MSDFNQNDTPRCYELHGSQHKNNLDAWLVLAIDLEYKLQDAKRKIAELESHFPAL